LFSLAIKSANTTANIVSEIDKTFYLLQIAIVGIKFSEIGERLQQPPKSKRGRPIQSQ
jgi:hypothetical protein